MQLNCIELILGLILRGKKSILITSSPFKHSDWLLKIKPIRKVNFSAAYLATLLQNLFMTLAPGWCHYLSDRDDRVGDGRADVGTHDHWNCLPRTKPFLC